MVFFNCNACGEALKKNQVEKHFLRCRQCQALSCVDCGKDFWGDDYQTHTKCMTEDQKYCGKGYVPKVNKGEVKQEQWIEKVQAAIEKSASNPKLKGLLEKLKDYPNIPRKKVKFENFLKNSLRVLSQPLIAQVWEMLMAATGQNQNQENGQKLPQQVSESVNRNHTGNDSSLTSEGIQPVVNSNESSNQKTSKRDRKEARKQKMTKKEKKDKDGDAKEKEDGFSKKKKRKHSEGEEDKQIETVTVETTDEPVRKKKKKQKTVTEDEKAEAVLHESEVNGTPAGDSQQNEEEVSEVAKKRKKVKFDWEGTVTAVLKSKGEISLKKMRRKVLQEFAAQNATNYTDENLKAKFDKKIMKMPQVKIQKDRVRLK